MPRPLKAIRPVHKKISIPEDLVAKVDLELWSEVEGTVPLGAWAGYIEALIRKDLKEKGLL